MVIYRYQANQLHIAPWTHLVIIQIPGQPAAYCTLDTSGHYTDTRPSSNILHHGHVWLYYRYQANELHIVLWTHLVIIQANQLHIAAWTYLVIIQIPGQSAAYCIMVISYRYQANQLHIALRTHLVILYRYQANQLHIAPWTHLVIILIPGQPAAYCTMDTSGHYIDTRLTSCILHPGHIWLYYTEPGQPPAYCILGTSGHVI